MTDISSIYDQEALSYEARYVSAMHLVEDQIISELLRTELSPGRRVLDVGCGTGCVIDWSEVSAADYLGVDVSKEMLAQARAKHPRHIFRHGDCRDGGLGQFDVVTAIYGQVNYIGLDAFCDVLDANLKANGRFLAVVYATKGDKDYAYTATHQEYFSSGQIREKLKARNYGCTVKGFSWADESALVVPQLGRTLRGATDGAKYFLVSNFKVLCS